jgi:hypothetical protein
MKVDTDHDPQANFGQYKTYAWAPEPTPPSGPHPIVQNTLFEKRLKESVDSQLPSRGLRPAAPGEQPDLLIFHHAHTQNEISSTNSGVGMGYYGGYPWGFGGYWGPSDVYEYKEGTIILDFVDPKNQQLVWRGVASDAINPAGPSPDQIKEAVKKMLAQYPPKDSHKASA